MRKYSCYIPVILILISFCSIILFRGSLTRYASRIMTNGMEPEEKSIVENIISEQYDYSKTRKDTNVHFSNLVRLVVIPAAKWNLLWLKLSKNTVTG